MVRPPAPLLGMPCREPLSIQPRLYDYHARKQKHESRDAVRGDAVKSAPAAIGRQASMPSIRLCVRSEGCGGVGLRTRSRRNWPDRHVEYHLPATGDVRRDIPASMATAQLRAWRGTHRTWRDGGRHAHSDQRNATFLAVETGPRPPGLRKPIWAERASPLAEVVGRARAEAAWSAARGRVSCDGSRCCRSGWRRRARRPAPFPPPRAGAGPPPRRLRPGLERLRSPRLRRRR